MFVSALISQAGPPREIVGAWVDERFELIASPALLEELRDVLARPEFPALGQPRGRGRVRRRSRAGRARARRSARPAGLTADPDDDYVIVLARAAGADYLVSGDRHLLDLDPPVLTPREFLSLLGA